jgi:DNA-binding LytR/AlgR family response regulator
MTGLPLDGRRVLVVEDEYLIAEDLREQLEASGAQVIGPVGHLEAALDHARDERIDAAVLDLNLGGAAAFPVADLLADRSVPMVFSTGYDAIAIPPRYAHVRTCIKPLAIATLVRALEQELAR